MGKTRKNYVLTNLTFERKSLKIEKNPCEPFDH